MPGSFCQWSADNVDHNISSIDGKGSLHDMGIIVSSSNSFSNDSCFKPVLRQKLRKADDVIQDKIIPIIPYESNILGLSLIKLRPMAESFVPNSLPKDILLDLVWHAKRFGSNICPSWSGYTCDISKGTYPGKPTVSMLPIINLTPNDMTCIFSTLNFITEQAKQLEIVTPVVTFDQPLWKSLQLNQ